MKIRVLVLTIIFIMMFSSAAMAYEVDYIINDGEHVPIPQPYIYSKTINSIKYNDEAAIKYFNQPADIFIDKNDMIYVVDTKNNRIVKLTYDGEAKMIFTEANGKKFNQPQGIYVDDNFDVYIADTGNSRIIQLSADGSFIKESLKPESGMLSDIAIYSPTKIAKSITGGLYVLLSENIMVIDENNRFRGFIGQTKIGFDFTEWLLRIVASDVQKKSIAKRLAASYDNFCVDDKGLIYAVSRDTVEGQVKILNSIGNNIYRKYTSVDDNIDTVADYIKNFFSGNIISKSFQYGESVYTTKWERPVFIDIAVSSDGIITAIQKQNGKIYQYDQTGNLLAVFGGLGSTQGKFAIPSSIAIDSQGRLYALDLSYGNIQIFEPTEFIKLVQQATIMYNNGNYDEASAIWEEIMRYDETYPLAHYGLASTNYKLGNWKAAMDGYFNSNNRVEYSKAFTEYRYKLLKNNFFIVVLLSLAIISLLYFIIVRMWRNTLVVLDSFESYKLQKLNFLNGLVMGLGILYRPGRALDNIKSGRGRLNVKCASFIWAVVVAVRFFFIYNVHYPLQDIEIQDVNFLLEIVKITFPVLSCIIAAFLISSQFNGESTLEENFVAMTYCMIPYIIVTIFATLFSQILCTQEKMLFALFVNGVTIWQWWLIIRAVKRLNDYNIRHTIFVCVITFFAVILIWFTGIFAYTLVARMIQFIEEILLEAQLVFF
ncbi:MAG TPA: hypothetical protein PK733_02260 [Clostridiales bacterium]|nr:hypothetical protein [Clostridiales bacterium]